MLVYLPSAASNYTKRSYWSYGCSGSFSSYSYPTGSNCTVSNKGTAAQYYQASYCSARAPTAAPTSSPTVPTYKPTPQPTSPSNKPTPQPTSPSNKPTPQPTTLQPTRLPTVAGAINTGYIVVTTYSDPYSYTCSTVSSVTLYRLGACIVDSPYRSYKYLNYDANFSPDLAIFNLSM